MKNKKSLLFIEVQVLILLVVFGIYKLYQLEEKVHETNIFVHKSIVDKSLEQVKQVKQDDILIGDKDAPITILLYTSFNCSACNVFYQDIYPKLIDTYVQNGTVKIVVRYVFIGGDKQLALNAAKAAHFAFQNDVYPSFVDQMNMIYPDVSNGAIEGLVAEYGFDMSIFQTFMADDKFERKLYTIAQEAREAGVVFSPMYFINDVKLMGSGNWEKIERVILSELDSESCES